MKKLLLIQEDDAYFLFETLQVVESFRNSFKDFQLKILVNEHALKAVSDSSTPLLNCFSTNADDILGEVFDVSVNLSLNEASWATHGKVKSPKKLGPYYQNDRLIVEDSWSSYFLTIKGKCPFLTFHLQDIYKNILGIRTRHPQLHDMDSSTIKRISFSPLAKHLFPVDEQEKFLIEISSRFPRVPVVDLSEVDLIEDLSEDLYIGPASLQALKFAEAGGKGIFLSSAFQGFNLLPYGPQHKFLSTRGSAFSADALVEFVEKEIKGEKNESTPYSLYSFDHEGVFGAYLKSHNTSDVNYPFYQSYVVLWNFLLNLFDTNLPVTKCSKNQVQELRTQQKVLEKYLRLHDYAMSSIDSIYQESKSKEADALKIKAHIQHLAEIEKVTEQIASSHVFLRPVLDFYKIRRGQNEGQSLFEQSQSSYLNYSEEHQALQALNELFSVTLKRNEVNI